MPDTQDTFEEFDDEATVPAPEAPVGRKPDGQNAGDVVDASDAKGGRYEAIGAGKLRRLAD